MLRRPNAGRCTLINTRVARPALGHTIVDLPRQRRTDGRKTAAAVAGTASAMAPGAGSIEKNVSRRWGGLLYLIQTLDIEAGERGAATSAAGGGGDHEK